MNFLREHAYDLRHASSKKLKLLALRAGAQPEDVAEAMTDEVAVGDRTTKLLSLVMELGVHTLFTPERPPEREAMPSGVRYEPTMPTLRPHRTSFCRHQHHHVCHHHASDVLGSFRFPKTV